MRFKLRAYRSPSPIPSLAGSTIRYKPVIPITFIGPRSQETPFALVDPGPDDIVFPVGFVSVPLRFALFGIAGGLQFFRTTLDGVRELELLPDSSLPVTQDAVR